tara:strand:+ start:437 stop:712 length:276 start_codon:yes stop_codon:yes gene_type:complete
MSKEIMAECFEEAGQIIVEALGLQPGKLRADVALGPAATIAAALYAERMRGEEGRLAGMLEAVGIRPHPVEAGGEEVRIVAEYGGYGEGKD